MSRRTLVLAGPLLLLLIGVLAPLGFIVDLSTGNGGGAAAYRTLVSSGPLRAILINTLWVSLAVVGITLLFGYTISLLLRLGRTWTRRLLAVGILLPFFTSVLIKSFALILVLDPNGPVQKVARFFGLGGTHFLYNWVAVVVGISYSLLPYMTLTLTSAVSSVDEKLILAARSLGARRRTILFRIFLPLTRDGIIGGCILTFVLSVGYYITPALLGGPSDSMLATVVGTDALTNLDFGAASAVSVGILVVITLLFVLYLRLFGVTRFVETVGK